MWNRASVQAAIRAAALVFVVAWLFVADLRAWIPFWLPLVALLAAEIEFVLLGRRDVPRGKRGRFGPGPEDADLGFGELVEDDEGFRYIPPPPRAPRQRRTFSWLVGGLAAAAVVAVAAQSDRGRTWQALPRDERVRTEMRLTSEAAVIAGRSVRISCDESYAFTGAGSDTLGIAFPRAGLAYLDPTICRSLRDLLKRSAKGERAAEAVVVLAHEAVHLGGERREGVTECRALQWAVPLAVRLGTDEGDARRLAEALYRQRLSERTAIRAAYALPSSCRNGGALDLHPEDARFP